MKRDYNSFSFKFGQNMRRIREEHGLTQEEISKYGISRGYYGKVELGDFSISIEKLHDLAKSLGVPIIEFFKDKNGNIIQ